MYVCMYVCYMYVCMCREGTKMKSRLGASISLVLTGQHKRGIFKSISVIPKFHLFNNRVVHCDSSLQLQGNGSFTSARFFHSSDEEDEFSELGPPSALGAGTVLKLMTEKREPFTKTNPAKKHSSGRSLPEECSLLLKDIFRNQSRHSSAPHQKSENHNDDSRFTFNGKKTSNLETSTSITIENVPSIVSLSQLIKPISRFGKISTSSMRTVTNDLNCCDVTFESVESSRRAISEGGITIRNIHLPIRPLHVSETVTIRIKNISNETTETAIHSMCVSVGSLEGISMAKRDAVDAFYRVKDNLDLESVLKKLNNTVIDGCRWSTSLLPTDSDPAMMTNNSENAKCKLGLQIGGHLAELKKQFDMKKIYAEDLYFLHNSIVHLECHPVVSDASTVD